MSQPKEEWLLALRTIVSERLRSVPHTAAMERNPLTETPNVVANTQHVIDGIVWGLNDRPLYIKDAWTVITNIIGERGKRLLNYDADNRGVPASARAEKEHAYKAHALMQDLYLSFCVADAVMKNCKQAIRRDSSLQTTIERDAIKLSAEYMPPFRRLDLPAMRIAAGEFTLLFLAIVNSWVAGELAVVSESARSRLEDHLRHVLKSQRRGTSSTADNDEQRLENLRALRTLTSSSEVTRAVKTEGGVRSREMSESTVMSFIQSIFPQRRNPMSNRRCAHCGVFLTTDEACKLHYRHHFDRRNLLEKDRKMVRLMNPSIEDFTAHIGDLQKKGYTPKIITSFEEAYKNGQKGFIEVRTAPEGTTE